MFVFDDVCTSDDNVCIPGCLHSKVLTFVFQSLCLYSNVLVFDNVSLYSRVFSFEGVCIPGCSHHVGIPVIIVS